MLFVVFRACSDCYAMEARNVIEVIPVVALRACSGTPAYVAGLANYRGTGLPVLDFCRLVAGASCPMRLGARIILIDHQGINGSRRTLGLLVEAVLETSELENSDFSETGIQAREASCLGKLAVRGNAFVQRVITERLLPGEIEKLLFQEQGSSRI